MTLVQNSNLTARKEKPWINSNGLGQVSYISSCWTGQFFNLNSIFLFVFNPEPMDQILFAGCCI